MCRMEIHKMCAVAYLAEVGDGISQSARATLERILAAEKEMKAAVEAARKQWREVLELGLWSEEEIKQARKLAADDIRRCGM